MFLTIALSTVMCNRTSNRLRKIIRDNSHPLTTLHVSEEVDLNHSFLTLSVHDAPIEADVKFHRTVLEILTHLHKRGCFPFVYDSGINDAPDELIGDGDTFNVYREIRMRYLTQCERGFVPPASFLAKV